MESDITNAKTPNRNNNLDSLDFFLAFNRFKKDNTKSMHNNSSQMINVWKKSELLL